MKKEIQKLLPKEKRIHFLGIGGIGMSAIARIMSNLGYDVSGSDQKESRNTIKIKEEGIKVFIGHNKSNIRGVYIVVVSSAIDKKNPELIAAQHLGITIIKRAKALGVLMDEFEDSFAFAGTHGKTTTSSMAAFLFHEAKLSPTFLIGGEVINLNTNAKLGSSNNFIAEADESDGSIEFLDPKNLIITNIEEDHLDHFSDINEIVNLFKDCVNKLHQKENHLLIINPDQWGNKLLLDSIDKRNTNILSFGLNSTNDISASELKFHNKGTSFKVNYKGQFLGIIELSIHGEHNVLNALPVIAIALGSGIDFNTIEVILKRFEGAKRRFHEIGSYNSIKIFDDYAHHPSEIKATLTATKNSYPDSKIIVAFQPHRYSRTMFFSQAFAESLAIADEVIITNIYSAGETAIKNVSGETITKFNDSFKYNPKKEEIPAYLENQIKENDIFITMGAGDIFNIGKELLNRLKQKGEKEQVDDSQIIRFA